MKKRIIALSLAASMLLGSFNVVFADNDVETTTANETVYDSENAVSKIFLQIILIPLNREKQ